MNFLKNSGMPRLVPGSAVVSENDHFPSASTVDRSETEFKNVLVVRNLFSTVPMINQGTRPPKLPLGSNEFIGFTEHR